MLLHPKRGLNVLVWRRSQVLLDPWFPLRPAMCPSVLYGHVLYPYYPFKLGVHVCFQQDDDDISFSTGDLIQVLEKKGDWWKGTVNGKTGR